MTQTLSAKEMRRRAEPVLNLDRLSRLLHAHELALRETRSVARISAEKGDEGTNDVLVSDIVRTNELQAWFISQHLVDAPVVPPSEGDR